MSQAKNDARSEQQEPLGSGSRAEKRSNYSTQPGAPCTPSRAEKIDDFVSAPQPGEGDSHDDAEGAESCERNDVTEKKGGRGRPKVFDRFAQAQFLGMITGGISQRTAALFMRIHPSTISKAIKRDKAFRKEVRQAQAAAKVRPLLSVIRASEKSWRAAVWLYRNAQPVTDLTEREAKRQDADEHERFAAEAMSMLDAVSDEIERRESAKQSTTTGDETAA